MKIGQEHSSTVVVSKAPSIIRFIQWSPFGTDLRDLCFDECQKQDPPLYDVMVEIYGMRGRSPEM